MSARGMFASARLAHAKRGWESPFPVLSGWVGDAGRWGGVGEDRLLAQEAHDRIGAGAGAAEAGKLEGLRPDLAQLGERQERVLNTDAAGIDPLGEAFSLARISRDHRR